MKLKLTEIYNNEILIPEFWDKFQSELIIDEEAVVGITNLIQSANDLVFKKFNITPNDRQYFIAGSAILYIYPQLKDVFQITKPLGDLDIVIPNKQLWLNAGLQNELNAGVYEPNKDIEVFDIWKPSKAIEGAGKEVIDSKTRPTNQILSEAVQINGYYFMPLQDVIAYKVALSRPKEKEFVDLIYKLEKNEITKQKFLHDLINGIGKDNTRILLNKIKEDVNPNIGHEANETILNQGQIKHFRQVFAQNPNAHKKAIETLNSIEKNGGKASHRQMVVLMNHKRGITSPKGYHPKN